MIRDPGPAALISLDRTGELSLPKVVEGHDGKMFQSSCVK
jgi:hypothetical protein